MSVSMDEIEQRAGAWILKRDAAEFSVADRAALEAWLAQDARHRKAYLNLDEAWSLTAGLNQWNPRDGRIDPDLLVEVSAAARPKRYWAAPLAAAASILIVIALAVGTQVSGVRATSYSTPIGGYERIPLEDGSILQLNTNTAVRARLTDTRREIRLLRGEAYFDVARDPRRPFEVMVGDSVARAVGTAFSVRFGAGNRLELMVTEGRVLLLPNNAENVKPVVAAGEAALARKGSLAIAPVPHQEIRRRLAWQTGQLVFDKQPLSVVAEEFNRYNRRQVQIATASLKSLQLTGNFKATDLDSFIAAVKSATNGQVDQTADLVVIRSR